MKTRTIIYADVGMILTDGDTYGKEILLADGVSKSDFYEITEDEYKTIMQEKETM